MSLSPPPAQDATEGIGAHMRRDHFALVAPQWSDYGPPQRPSPFDTARVQDCADALRPGARVVILGLTPEMVTCRWPPGVDLCAVDHSPAMHAMLWPQAGAPPGARAVVSGWERLPAADRSVDLVLGDGCQTTLRWPDGFERFQEEVRRVLAPDGHFLLRVFLRPDVPESLAAIGADLAAGRVGSVHALKQRLWGALHGTSGVGTRLGDVWQAWKTLPPHPQPPGQRGWTPGEIATMDNNRDLDTRYYAATLAEMRQALSGRFIERACHVGDYELAERCPTLVLQRRD